MSKTSVKAIMWEHQPNKHGEYPVRIRITKNRRSKYKTIPKLFVTPESWKAMEPALDRILEHLAGINEAMREVHEENQRHDFFEFADQWIERYNNQENEGFYRGTKAIINKFRKFTGAGKITFQDITHSLLLDYLAWLKQRKDKHGKLLNKPNTRSQAIRKLRMVFKAAIREKLISRDTWPFDGLKLEKNNTVKVPLTTEELDRIRQLDLPVGSDLWDYRNLFLLCFNNMGMRIGDALKLEPSHVAGGKIRYAMGKSKDVINIAQTGEAKQIIDHYLKHCKERKYLFPVLKENDSRSLYFLVNSAGARVNKGLKEIAFRARIKVKLSTHIARHTWSNLAKQKGVDPSIIQEALGHEDYKTTQNYLKDFESKVLDKANKKVVGETG